MLFHFVKPPSDAPFYYLKILHLVPLPSWEISPMQSLKDLLLLKYWTEWEKFFKRHYFNNMFGCKIVFCETLLVLRTTMLHLCPKTFFSRLFTWSPTQTSTIPQFKVLEGHVNMSKMYFGMEVWSLQVSNYLWTKLREKWWMLEVVLDGIF